MPDLHSAASGGNLDELRTLLAAGADVDQPGALGITPLHAAAVGKKPAAVKWLLEQGATVDARSYEDNTPLHYAAEGGDARCIALLLDHGARIEAKTGHVSAWEADGFTPLHVAARHGHAKAIQALLARGAKIDARDRDDKATPLLVALAQPALGAARVLVAAGAGVNARTRHPDAEGYTALHFALEGDPVSLPLVRLLLEHGADPGRADAERRTPMAIAEDTGGKALVDLLAKHGGKRSKPSAPVPKPVKLAAALYKLIDDEGYDHDKALALIAAGADVRWTPPKEHWTLLHTICSRSSRDPAVEIVAALIKAGADVNLKTAAGWAPLDVVLRDGDKPISRRIVRLLLAAGARPSAKSKRAMARAGMKP